VAIRLGNNQQKSTLLLPYYATNPLRRVHSHDLLESNAKCIVTAEATLESQLLGGCSSMRCKSFMVEIDKMLDAQTVDIVIVSDSLQTDARSRFRLLAGAMKIRLLDVAKTLASVRA